ncbi:MAG: ABC transporter permease [Bacteroides sp.]|nr:ABC transporter permease [Bacteroides sp.]
MYLRILKKDLKRKKTMNVILLIFVILAATFIAASANDLITVSGALDSFFAKANVPDHWFGVTSAADVEAFGRLAAENGYDYKVSRLVQIDPKNVFVDGKKLDYSGILSLSSLGDTKLFDKNDREITEINDGEIYVTGHMFLSETNNFYEGCKVLIKQGGAEKIFTIKGYTKDALFGSPMMGITRFAVSENDAALFGGENPSIFSLTVSAKDPDYTDKFNALGLNTMLLSVNRSGVKTTYIMDVLTAAVLMTVSVCLIIISMVILHFIISFTIMEDFREIGVMKAIGLKSSAIRGLYTVKYFAVAVTGALIGAALSFPFGKLMINEVEQKIVISGEDNYIVNILAAAAAGGFVILFAFFCTRKIRRFSPIEAIHSGETGERFRKKSVLSLSRSHLAVVPFMALNDILSGVKSYISMIIIFILGTLLVTIPANTVNTLRSDDIMTAFNMVRSDHIIDMELLFNPKENNAKKIEDQLAYLREALSENNIEANVFQEILFRSRVSHNGSSVSSLSFQGAGDVTADKYAYIEGSAPQNAGEVALSYITAGQIGAEIGDRVEIKLGETTDTYTVTAITQSMNNMGEGVRFHQDAKLDYSLAMGSFGLQIDYRDSPDGEELSQRMDMLRRLYPDDDVYICGEYINNMIGVAEQLDGLKTLILTVVLCVNMLVALLMVKSFVAKEKSEIALLKSLGFGNGSLVLWQSARIGIVLLISVIAGALLSSPLSTLIITPVFRMMGAFSINLAVNAAEIYVLFPLTVLAATMLAAFISAQSLRGISSVEAAE